MTAKEKSGRSTPYIKNLGIKDLRFIEAYVSCLHFNHSIWVHFKRQDLLWGRVGILSVKGAAPVLKK